MATQSNFSELSEREQVKSIRAEIWRLVQQAPDLETVHWYTWVDDCFENDEFLNEDWHDIKWRIQVLHMKHEPINRLANMIDQVVPPHVRADGTDAPVIDMELKGSNAKTKGNSKPPCRGY